MGLLMKACLDQSARGVKTPQCSFCDCSFVVNLGYECLFWE